MGQVGNGVVQRFTQLEPLLLVVMIIAFWYPDPRRVWALALLIPIAAARWIAYGRLWTRTPLDGVWIVFVSLCLVNIFIAESGLNGAQDTTPPFTRGLLMLGRPIMGIALAAGLIESVRVRGRMNRSVWALVLLSALIAVLGIGASAWTEKSDQIRFLINPLPRLPNWEIIRGGFNVNEIGGVLATIVPMMAGIALSDSNPTRRRIAGVIFWIGLLAAFAGQSRLALAGIIAALFAISFLIIPPGRRRVLAVGGVIIFAIIELIIISGILATGEVDINERDESSWQTRFYIWESALDIIQDYPLTGVGLNMFRDGRVRALYPVPGYEAQVLPHTHNEWLQLGTDMGLPGILMFAAWYITLSILLWRIWRQGDTVARGIAVACAGALLSHGIYALADAIPLWDRFAFVHYAVTGLVLAQHWLVTHPDQDRVMLKLKQSEAFFQWRTKNPTSSDG